MVNVTYKRAHLPYGNVQYHLEATGHAGYSVNGDDIVCAGVSTLFYTLANYLDQKGADDLTASDGENFFIDCKGLYHDEVVHTAFQMTVFGLMLLEEQYPDNVQVTEEPDD